MKNKIKEQYEYVIAWSPIGCFYAHSYIFCDGAQATKIKKLEAFKLV